MLNLESDAVRRHLWVDRDSVVRSYLRDGADNGLMMDGTSLLDLLPPPAGSPAVAVYGGFVRITLPPRSARVLAPDVGTQGGRSVYKRVR